MGIWMARDHNLFINADAARLAVENYQDKWQQVMENTKAEEGEEFWDLDEEGNGRDFHVTYASHCFA
jgi:hypothetical protein